MCKYLICLFLFFLSFSSFSSFCSCEQLHSHVGLKFSGSPSSSSSSSQLLQSTASMSNLPKLHAPTTTLNHSQSMAGSIRGFGSTSASRSVLAMAALTAHQQQQLLQPVSGSQTERGPRRNTHSSTLQQPLPALSSTYNSPLPAHFPGVELGLHFSSPAQPQAPSSLQPSAMYPQPTHPRFQKLLNEAEKEREKEERSMREDEHKSDSPTPPSRPRKFAGTAAAASASASVTSLHAQQQISTTKLDLANVEHFDAIQEQVQAMV